MLFRSQLPFYSIATLVGGEPLLRKDFIDILAYTSKKIMNKVHVVSNGILINDEIIKAFIKYKLLLLSVSLDGYGETHDKNRGKTGIFSILPVLIPAYYDPCRHNNKDKQDCNDK